MEMTTEKANKPRKAFKDYDPGFSMQTSNICPRCPIRTIAAICSWPSTGPAGGSTGKSIPTRRQPPAKENPQATIPLTKPA